VKKARSDVRNVFEVVEEADLSVAHVDPDWRLRKVGTLQKVC
jgi:hypothetical protein